MLAGMLSINAVPVAHAAEDVYAAEDLITWYPPLDEPNPYPWETGTGINNVWGGSGNSVITSDRMGQWMYYTVAIDVTNVTNGTGTGTVNSRIYYRTQKESPVKGKMKKKLKRAVSCLAAFMICLNMVPPVQEKETQEKADMRQFDYARGRQFIPISIVNKSETWNNAR